MPAAHSTHPSTTHPSTTQLRAFAQGRLPPDQMAGVESHVAVCDACCQQLQKVPDDTLIHLAREAATFGFRQEDSPPAPAKTPAHEIPPELRDHPRYRVLGLVATGGMGAVYKAEHRLMGRLVALKVISPAFLKNEAAVERFHREFRAVARLSHPNVVTAYDADNADNLHFLVMEFVEGLPLDRLVQQTGRLPVARACQLIRLAALGLQHMHERGMVHRDIKPQNVMIGRKDQVKVLDCGLARLAGEGAAEIAAGETAGADRPGATTAGMILGTPDFIAPEQAADARSADVRSDIYSLGCTLYFALTGQPPFPKGSFVEKLTQHQTAQPAPIQTLRPDVPPELVRVIERMMAKRPSDRYQVPGEVAKDLTPLARDEKSSGKRNASPGNPPQAAEPLVQVAADDEVPATLLDPLANLDLGSIRNLPPVVKAGSGGGFSMSPPQLVAVLLACGIALAIMILAVPVARWLLPAASPAKQTAGAPGATKSGIPIPAKPPVEPPAVRLGSKSSDSPALAKVAVTPGSSPALATPSDKIRILLVVPHDGLFLPDYEKVKDAIDKYGLKMHLASSQHGAVKLKFRDDELSATLDRVLNDQWGAKDYDAIIFTGYETDEFTSGGLAFEQTQRLLREFTEQGKLVTAICRGQRVLAKHGQLQGKRVAYSQYAKDSYGPGGAIVSQENIERDGQIITAAADEDAEAFVAAILTAFNK